jgi:hypothetical protein
MLSAFLPVLALASVGRNFDGQLTEPFWQTLEPVESAGEAMILT